MPRQAEAQKPETQFPGLTSSDYAEAWEMLKRVDRGCWRPEDKKCDCPACGGYNN